MHGMLLRLPTGQDNLMVKENDYVAIFHSIHRVLKAEKLLKQAGVEFLLIPVPRQLTSDCGLALRFSPGARERLLDVLSEATLTPAEIYQRRGDAYLDVSAQT
ncbi:MAG: DUF3343 domain-containing protein [Desulfuromonadales bacterium]